MADESFEILDEESFFEGGPTRSREERRRARAAAAPAPQEPGPAEEADEDGVVLLIGDELEEPDEPHVPDGGSSRHIDDAVEAAIGELSGHGTGRSSRGAASHDESAASRAAETRTPVQHASDRLREILDETGVFSDVDLLGVQESAPREFLGDVLIDRGMLRECDIHGMLIRSLHIPFINADQLAVDAGLTDLVEEDFCHDHDLVPIARARRFLTVATSNPLNEHAFDLLAQLCGLTPRPVLCSFHDLQTLIERAYQGDEDVAEGDRDAAEMSSLVSEAAELLATSQEEQEATGGEAGEPALVGGTAAGTDDGGRDA
jgi:hypothetical protein